MIKDMSLFKITKKQTLEKAYSKFKNALISNKRLLFWVLVGGLALFFLMYKTYPYLPREIRYRVNACLIYQEFNCYEQQAHKIAKNEGSLAAIEYTKSVILPKWGFGVTHFILHRVGEDAIYQLQDVSKALLLIKPYQSEKNLSMDGFDGYLHGVFRGYFKMKSTTPVTDLMKHVCSEYYNEIQPEMDHSMMNMAKADECFHGVGHALMYLNGNNIPKSISDCKLSKFQWMYKACIRGVFMEEMYHFSPAFSKGVEYNTSQSMLYICENYTGEELNTCATFIGESYLHKKPTDIEGAFEECRKTQLDTTRKNCMDRIALLWLPAVYKNDFSKIIEVCISESGDFSGSCLKSANRGIRFGGAGVENKDRPFCELIQETKLRESCK